jgi:hypothetical protein
MMSKILPYTCQDDKTLRPYYELCHKPLHLGILDDDPHTSTFQTDKSLKVSFDLFYNHGKMDIF